MKKLLSFFAYPVVMILSSVIFAFCINSYFFYFSIPFELIFIVLIGGFILSKIEDKKIRIASTAFVSVLLAAASIAVTISLYLENTDAAYGFLVINPLALAISQIIYNDSWGNEILGVIYTVVCAFIPFASLLASKLFKMEKGKIKNICFAVIAVAIVGLGVWQGVSSANALKGMKMNGQILYFDVNGNSYEDDTDVPYYDIQGNKYYWTTDGAESDDSLYCGELTDEKGNKHSLDNIYVNTEGYLYFDTNDSITDRSDIPDDVMTDWRYEDKEGNIYTSILSICYDTDGSTYVGMGNEYKTR